MRREILAAVMGADILALSASGPPEWVKHYGGPSDLFLRIVDRYSLSEDGETLHCSRVVVPRAMLPDTICITIGFVTL